MIPSGGLPGRGGQGKVVGIRNPSGGSKASAAASPMRQKGGRSGSCPAWINIGEMCGCRHRGPQALKGTNARQEFTLTSRGQEELLGGLEQGLKGSQIGGRGLSEVQKALSILACIHLQHRLKCKCWQVRFISSSCCLSLAPGNGLMPTPWQFLAWQSVSLI